MLRGESEELQIIVEVDTESHVENCARVHESSPSLGPSVKSCIVVTPAFSSGGGDAGGESDGILSVMPESVDDVVNMQVWSVAPESTDQLVGGFIDRLILQGQVTYLNTSHNTPEVPTFGVKSGR